MREGERNFLFQKIRKDEDVMNHRLAVLKTKPKPLEPYKHPSNEVVSRPVAVLDDSEDLRPGKKLPMLIFPKVKKTMQNKSSNISLSNSQNLSQNSLNTASNNSESEKNIDIPTENDSNQKLEGGELYQVSSEVTDAIAQSID